VGKHDIQIPTVGMIKEGKKVGAIPRCSKSPPTSFLHPYYAILVIISTHRYILPSTPINHTQDEKQGREKRREERETDSYISSKFLNIQSYNSLD
jgi:hypothetical protein